jgi:hypothetical protein
VPILRLHIEQRAARKTRAIDTFRRCHRRHLVYRMLRAGHWLLQSVAWPESRGRDGYVALPEPSEGGPSKESAAFQVRQTREGVPATGGERTEECQRKTTGHDVAPASK